MLGPIFAREFLTTPRRERHHTSRLSLLILLWVLGLTAWQATVGFNRVATLGQTARFGALLFQIYTFVVLALLLFFSALSAASTVSREKDRRTFILLLLTDMRDFEIVVGKMLGSLLPVGLLLLGAVPVLTMLMLLGGVSAPQVFQATVVLAATGVAGGSIGGLIALWREKTFQSLALSVLSVVFYLIVVQGIPLVGGLISPSTDWGLVQACFDPFTALGYVLQPPVDRELAIDPAWGFLLTMAALCAVLNGIGIVMLRKWNPSGEPIMQRETPSAQDEEDIEKRKAAHAAPGRVREVWANPILWREVCTYAYGRRPILIKLTYGLVLALILWFAVSTLSKPEGRPSFASAYGIVPIAVLSLLLLSAQAVTAITSERDGRQLDLLLVTDLTPNEFVFGKILGILWNTREYLIPPFLLALYYAIVGAFAPVTADLDPWTRFSLSFGPMVCIAGAILILLAFGLMLGLHVALRVENSRTAIINTLGTIFFLSVGSLISIYLIVINGGSLGSQLLSFSAFICLGIGGLWWVLTAGRSSPALSLAATVCPMAMFYSVTNILIARPGSTESADPLIPFLVIGGAFGFSIAAMLVPLLGEFDVALGRTTANEE